MFFQNFHLVGSLKPQYYIELVKAYDIFRKNMS